MKKTLHVRPEVVDALILELNKASITIADKYNGVSYTELIIATAFVEGKYFIERIEACEKHDKTEKDS